MRRCCSPTPTSRRRLPGSRRPTARVERHLHRGPGGQGHRRARGTLQDNYVTDLYAKNAEVKRYTTADDLVLDMDAGRLDIAFLDFPVGKSTLIDGGNGNYKAVGEVVTEPKKYFGDGFGIAMRKRDKDLAEQINGALAELKADGTYDTIHTKYFGEKK